MRAADIMQFVPQIAFVFISCFVLRIIGLGLYSFFDFGTREENNERKNFLSLLLGTICVVTLYALASTGFKTSMALVLLAGSFCLRKRNIIEFDKKISRSDLPGLLLLSACFVILFNVLPESEYKQKDSFFYLKISEALNLTGQENTSNYYNLFSNKYHGVEAYHYFECWLNAILLKIVPKTLPAIQVFRIITYGIISVTFIYGLFYLWRSVTGKSPRSLEKLVCFAFVFFLPDIFPYLPEVVKRYLVFNFENNFLERPNFRLIYLFMLPIIGLSIERSFGKIMVFFFACAIIINPTFFITLAPAMALFILFVSIRERNKYGFITWKDIILLLSLSCMYILFYYFFSTKGVPPMYVSGIGDAVSFYNKSFKYVGLTIATSLAYISVLIVVAWVLMRIFSHDTGNTFIRKNINLFIFLGIFIFFGVIIARALGFIENMYQVAFNSYVATSVLIFILFILVAKKSAKHALVIILVFVSGYAINKFSNKKSLGNIFIQNGKYSYAGIPYSQEYIESVALFVKEEANCRGAFIADSSYYKDLYYSARNPNVYHLPITYLIANRVHSNVDYCLSSPAAIKYTADARLANNKYLNNAIERSYTHDQEVNSIGSFLKKHQLRYLVLTPGVSIDSIPGVEIKNVIIDKNTKERFLMLAD